VRVLLDERVVVAGRAVVVLEGRAVVVFVRDIDEGRVAVTVRELEERVSRL